MKRMETSMERELRRLSEEIEKIKAQQDTCLHGHLSEGPYGVGLAPDWQQPIIWDKSEKE